MAPSSGHILIPKVLRVVKYAVSQAKAHIRGTLHSSPARIYFSNCHSSQLLAPLRGSRSRQRWISSTFRKNFSRLSTSTTPCAARGSFRASSKVGQVLHRQGAVPFATTLRPNLTGGALPRSAGGYGLGGGGGVRHFSHTPGSQAQVIQNVSAGMRAFVVGGGKARYHGVDPMTGEKRFRAIGKAEDETLRHLDAKKAYNPHEAKGSRLEFHLSPTITAIFPSHHSSDDSPSILNAETLTALSVDFAHTFQDLAVTLSDLRLLSSLGDLPINISYPNLNSSSARGGPVISLHFPGCDGGTLSRLCDEAGVRRGVIREDETWQHDRDVEMALLFPMIDDIGSTGNSIIIPNDNELAREREDAYRPTSTFLSARPEQLEWHEMMSSAPAFSSPAPVALPTARSTNASTCTSLLGIDTPPGTSSTSSSSTKKKRTRPSPQLPRTGNPTASPSPSRNRSRRRSRSSSGSSTSFPSQAEKRTAEVAYEGIEGILRFLTECERARR